MISKTWNNLELIGNTPRPPITRGTARRLGLHLPAATLAGTFDELARQFGLTVAPWQRHFTIGWLIEPRNRRS